MSEHNFMLLFISVYNTHPLKHKTETEIITQQPSYTHLWIPHKLFEKIPSWCQLDFWRGLQWRIPQRNPVSFPQSSRLSHLCSTNIQTIKKSVKFESEHLNSQQYKCYKVKLISLCNAVTWSWKLWQGTYYVSNLQSLELYWQDTVVADICSLKLNISMLL